jgi:hypothetical protein
MHRRLAAADLVIALVLGHEGPSCLKGDPPHIAEPYGIIN